MGHGGTHPLLHGSRWWSLVHLLVHGLHSLVHVWHVLYVWHMGVEGGFPLLASLFLKWCIPIDAMIPSAICASGCTCVCFWYFLYILASGVVFFYFFLLLGCSILVTGMVLFALLSYVTNYQQRPMEKTLRPLSRAFCASKALRKAWTLPRARRWKKGKPDYFTKKQSQIGL